LSLPLSLSPSLSICWTIAIACRRLRPNCARSCVPAPDLGFYMSRIFSFCIDSIFVFTIDFCFQGSNGDVLSIFFCVPTNVPTCLSDDVGSPFLLSTNC
jgi:hypothetical protein